ncbi:MAG: hypothetical protein Q4A37_00465 [Candidatus Saccharibacteria bacterium]|nr:hypothetical protein [Candidatus Saccharibacteria bacterium]
MTDIDFDELDKAVNSLMNQRGDESSSPAASVTAPAAASATTVATAPVSSVASATPAPSAAPAPAPTAPIVSTPPTEAFVAPAPAIAKRPAGRFMDVVHPSSDMTNNRPASPRPSRTGVSLQPASQVAATTPSTEAQSVSSDTAATPAPTAAELAMADALDTMPVAGQEVAVEPTPEPEPTEQAAPTPVPTADDLTEKIAASLQASATTAPLESPFLTDAVVEKRPLGSASETVAPDTMTANAVATPEVADETVTVQPSDSDAAAEWQETAKGDVLAPELSKDIMAIESGEAVSSDTMAATPIIGADIPQQYTPEVDTAPEPAPMFDAASLTPGHDMAAPKKKSGILTVLLILLFALLGVAGGAAAYFLLLQ